MLSYQTADNSRLHWRRTKIIATLGPASNTEARIAQLIDRGVNVFRLNMSHGSHEEHRELAAKVRRVAQRKKTADRPVDGSMRSQNSRRCI